MKNSIPSDVWERKKALIAQLYKDEEWPLKQVIKKIRSEDFNPSETQLRSRLKKWRVTKPSRQTRKKSNDSQQEGSGDDSSREDGSPHCRATTVSPKSRHHIRSAATENHLPESDWFMNGSFAPHDDLPATVSLDHAWAPVLSQHSPSNIPSKQRESSHASVVVPSSSVSHTSPLLDDVLLNPTTSMPPGFHEHPYCFTAEPYMQTPASTAATAGPIQWSMPQWYSMPMDHEAQAPPMPFYTAAPLSPPIDPAMHLISPTVSQRIYAPRTPSRRRVSDLRDDGAQLWKRTMSAPYVQDTAAGHARLEQKGLQSTSVDRKASLPSKPASPHNMGLMTPPPSFFPPGQHSAMCAPVYNYPGPEPLVHRPPSIDF
ncbi:uncharacterized protein BP01DRAFT_138422 [Aspergillus saccharolyticus JOP 1030-1]|uniref:Clr5 domain-containing protein n=1 Tax=Aspergillus saccharolyticus JOP 1030-1 TaxID=1450539 RepID=A0A319A428_9EURO|nr:hypothetical protein BP01DRAFT_138422 [Aspergillus saccharolyticus JOP 1030-1]PYH42182.1 hypothetical protein BP01DRAFT_138422 [Aspergillus saccharolyticus JOP 1030-1]